jgi:diaminohydroxyphosphoribosylaminopyrimidine deaminase / 5-amino-6-(5-phosphoribosylamino)uracil reductase
MDCHQKWMRLAIAQAKQSWNTTQPNPAVGSIIVKSGHLIGGGHTLPAGDDHAEIQAIKNSPTDSLTGAIMYVTLEPCSHHGQTPPCVDSIIATGIAKVVIGVSDPNPLVSGQGIQKLKRVGIEVVENVLANEITKLYQGFFTFISKKRPYLTMKLSQSQNGCIAGPNKTPAKITSAASNVWVHNLRAQANAILVGGSTARIDNPSLDTRLSNFETKHDPTRIILNLESDLDAGLNIFRDDGVDIMVFGKKRQALPDRIKQYQLPAVEFGENLRFVLDQLYLAGIHHLLIESGGELTKKLLASKLFDTFYLFTSPHSIENGYKWNDSGWQWQKGLKLCKTKQVGNDLLEEFAIMPSLIMAE